MGNPVYNRVRRIIEARNPTPAGTAARERRPSTRHRRATSLVARFRRA